MANKINKITKNGATYDIEDPNAATKTELSAETSARQNADGDLQTAINGKQAALSADQMKAVNSGADSTKIGQIATNTTNIASNSGEIATINGKIPATATSSNQLADKQFVNSTVQTASANFRGNWATWSDVPTDANDYPADADGNKTPTKNDYMVVQDASDYPTSPDPALEGTWRFKYTGTWATDGKDGWYLEYQVNETPLTSDQLAALNSGITAEAVAKLGGIESGAEVNDINSISVNGTAVTPDANKNVELTIPEGIKTLTTADYNYPTTGTKTAIALWLLDPGYYKIDANAVWLPQSSDAPGSRKGGLAIIGLRSSSGSTYSVPIIAMGNGLAKMTFAGVVTQNGTYNQGLTDAAFAQYGGLLSTGDVVNNLTSTGLSAQHLPLSANQGRILNNTKADKTAFTGTDGTAAGTMGLVPAPATTDAGKFLKADGSWGEAGGGVKTLTTADYNYPTDNPNCVGLWLLQSGVYKINQTMIIRGSSGSSGPSVSVGDIIIISKGDSGVTKAVIITTADSSRIKIYNVKSTTGSNSAYASSPQNSDILTVRDVNATLTSTSNAFPLAASQGKVLKDLIDSLVIKNAGAPTTSTTGTKGQLLEDTTNGNLYICTNSASPYAWKQIDKDEILTNAGAPTTSTAGTLGQLLTDTTNAKLYQLTAIDTTDPQNPSYTWSEVGGSSGPTVVQTTGTSTTDVMSQKAVTEMVFADNSSATRIKIGASAQCQGAEAVAIGRLAKGTQNYSVAIGTNATIGNNPCSVAIGAFSRADQRGEMNIGSTNTFYGYNSSNYRLLTGVYDGQSAHDAATKGQLDTAIINGGTTAPTSTTAGAVGTQYTYVDTTGTPTAHLCVCTEIDNTDPSNPVYTWQTLI